MKDIPTTPKPGWRMVNVTEDDSDSSIAEAEKHILNEQLEPETHDGARAISKR